MQWHPCTGVGSKHEHATENRLWGKVWAWISEGDPLQVGHVLPGLGRPSIKSPANFLCSVSCFAPFMALMDISLPPPTLL